MFGETSEKKKKIDKKLIAKRDFEIHCNDYHRIIKEGDDVSDVPEMYLVGLRTEKVL